MCIGQEGPRVEAKCRIKGTRAGGGPCFEDCRCCFRSGDLLAWREDYRSISRSISRSYVSIEREKFFMQFPGCYEVAEQEQDGCGKEGEYGEPISPWTF